MMDAEIAAVLEDFPELQFENPAAQRQWFADRLAELPSAQVPAGIGFDEILVASTRDEHMIPVRRYRADTYREGGPVIVWIHGGGFCIGTAAEDEGLCVLIAHKLSAVVLSVDYRLAPEFPFPTGFEDCWDVLAPVLARDSDILGTYESTGPILVAGASAGACLAAVLSLRARDEGLDGISGQILVTPFLDPSVSSEAAEHFENASVFDTSDATTCWQHYLGAHVKNPPRYSTPLISKKFDGIAPAYVLVAGQDCLRDDGIEYARALMSSHVEVELHVVPGVPHGFTGVAPQAVVSRRLRRELLDVLAAHVERACSTSEAHTDSTVEK